jgi:hypothetical protein
MSRRDRGSCISLLEIAHNYGHAIAKAVSRGLPSAEPGFNPRPGYAGFVVDKGWLVQVSSKYFNFPYHFSFHRLLYYRGLVAANVTSDLSLTPHPARQEIKRKNLEKLWFPLLGHNFASVRGNMKVTWVSDQFHDPKVLPPALIGWVRAIQPFLCVYARM